MIRHAAIIATLALASAALATAPIRPAEMTARPGRIVSSYDGQPGRGDGWIALDGFLRTTGIFAQVRFEPGRRCRILGVEFVARTVVGNAYMVPVVMTCPDADYTITGSNMFTSARTNWIESVNTWTMDSGSVQSINTNDYARMSVGSVWSHWVVVYDPSAPTRQWRFWKNGTQLGWHARRRNSATSWNPDGMFSVSFGIGIGSPATTVELQYFRPFMAPSPLTDEDFRRSYMRWRGSQ